MHNFGSGSEMQNSHPSSLNTASLWRDYTTWESVIVRNKNLSNNKSFFFFFYAEIIHLVVLLYKWRGFVNAAKGKVIKPLPAWVHLI